MFESQSERVMAGFSSLVHKYRDFLHQFAQPRAPKARIDFSRRNGLLCRREKLDSKAPSQVLGGHLPTILVDCKYVGQFKFVIN